MSKTVYRKTAQGMAEMAQRKGQLPLRARAVLLMVNGVDAAARLLERLGNDAAQTLAWLVQEGYIEAVPASGMAVPDRQVDRGQARARPAPASSPWGAPSAPPVSTPTPTPVPAPAPAPPAAAAASIAPSPPVDTQPAAGPASFETMQDHARRLLHMLVPHFGPDAPRIAEAALLAVAARDAPAFNLALDSVAARLAIHMGKKRAVEKLGALRLPT